MLDDFFDLRLQTRLLVYGLALALLAGVYLFGVHFPQADQIARHHTQLAALLAERHRLQTQVAQDRTIRDNVAATERLLTALRTRLPDHTQTAQLLRQVANLGQAAGLEVVLFRQQPEVKKTVYAEIPVEMSVRGGYHQTALFFDRVRQLERIVHIGSLSMKKPDQEPVGAGDQVETSFFATTYRLLSEDELAEQAPHEERA